MKKRCSNQKTDAPLVRDILEADYQWIISAHRRHYTEVEHFDSSFETAVCAAIEDFRTPPHPSVNRAFILDDENHPAGSILCLHQDEQSVRLKLFFVESRFRRLGYGKKLLNQVISHLRDYRYHQVEVSTYSSHQEACALYAASGFNLINEKPVTAYGQDLIEQHWRLSLQGQLTANLKP